MISIFAIVISEYVTPIQALPPFCFFSTPSQIEYGPVTMIVPASGHQVRCIPWVQMGTFNKEIGFYVD